MSPRHVADVSTSPEILEPRRRQLGVSHGVLDVAMPQVSLQGARVVPFVRERIAASVPEHVRVRLKAELGLRTTRAKPAVLKGAPRSEVKTKGDLGSSSRCRRRRARSSSPRIGAAVLSPPPRETSFGLDRASFGLARIR
jgi:hypothetical protein